MAQTLVIGLGGTGSRVVNNVVEELGKNKKKINDGNICCAVLDTNKNENKMLRKFKNGLPIIDTSKPQKIRDYINNYEYMGITDWCPQSPVFLGESMIDGASEVRIKSRIAFFDTAKTDVIIELEKLINSVLQNGNGSKIRIMLVSSLSGGTGSGMFIQVALWLRKFLSKSQITIRGIFLLPDIFIENVADIKNSKKTSNRHYANAYAAIRELNAISKIMRDRSFKTSRRIELDNLFDSDEDFDLGHSVFDYCFFVDNRDRNGVALNSVGEYEKVVAQLVYMQLFAPMASEMYSEEDNAFLAMAENPEPLYGACGTSKAVYPRDSVIKYCAVRAAKEAVSGGWRKIDAEIAALEREKEEEEKEGFYSGGEINRAYEYVRIFDEKTSVKTEEAASDRFFISIANDTKNISYIRGENDRITTVMRDKVDDFIKIIKNEKIDTAVIKYSTLEDFAINAEAFVADDHDRDELRSKIRSDESGMEEAIVDFESNAEKYAISIVNSIFPYSMGDVKTSNRNTIYGLLSKQDSTGKYEVVHPVAARYMLYKLVSRMEEELKRIVIEDSRQDALSGGDVSQLFDNKATKAVESTPLEHLESIKGKKPKAFDNFEEIYAQFINSKIGLCEKYEKEYLQIIVFRKLIERLKGLITKTENFFFSLREAEADLDVDLKKLENETAKSDVKVIYVYGSREAKEEIYESLNLGLSESNATVNKGVIDAVYGSYCASKRPDDENNKPYVDVSMKNQFIDGIINVFGYKLVNDPDKRDKVDFDIYTAMKLESQLGKTSPDEEIHSDRVYKFLADEEDSEPIIEADSVFAEYHKRLLIKAEPMLDYITEAPADVSGEVTSRKKTFWGFNPALVKNHPNIEQALRINADLQGDEGYAKGELYCYVGIYGLEAKYVPKFKESAEKGYYTCYERIINDMEQRAKGREGERAYISTPHLDMRWHNMLPYITSDMQSEKEIVFYLGFWLAVAYGIIKTDKNENFVIRRMKDMGFGERVPVDTPILHEGKKIKKTDVVELLSVLKEDLIFINNDIPEAKKRFEDELKNLSTYVGTKVYKGLAQNKDELNAVTFIVRYKEDPTHDEVAALRLVSAIQKIADDMARSYRKVRSEEDIEKAKYGICRRIYDASGRVAGKEDAFSNWLEKFKELGIEADSELD